ncbi:acyltransferase family protein [Mycobacterium kansasii 824]|nr:acyltransferase family protein [Mycobacterium kansasii 824]
MVGVGAAAVARRGPSLRRTGRAASAVAFAAYTWAVYLVLGLALVLLLLLLPRERWRWWAVRRSIRLLARLTGTAITVHGLNHLPAQTCIAVANHPSWIDGIVLASVLPPSFHFVVAEQLQQGLYGFALRRLGTQFVERHQREQGVADTDQLVGCARAGSRWSSSPKAG